MRVLEHIRYDMCIIFSGDQDKCIFIHWMNTLIITEAELIIKGDATVQLRISAVLLRKTGRWDVPYAYIQAKPKKTLYFSDIEVQNLRKLNIYRHIDEKMQVIL